ncbi:hypothetical protein Tco_1465736 [Tanacetum coccineum]
MEMEPDIENMTLNEYLEYEAKKERRLWDNVRSKSSPTRYERADFNSSHRDKSISLDFPHYYKDAFIDKYYALPPLLPCFQPSQPHNERGNESPNTNNEVDIYSMKIAEYNLYIARQMKNPLNDHFYSFTPQFFAQPPNTPNTHVDKKDSDFDEILDDLFSVGAKNLRRMGQEKVQHGCNFDTSRDTNHESGNLLNFPIFPATNEFSSIYEQDVDLEKEEAEVADDDDGDTYDIWDITSILDELFDEFDDEIVNVTMIDEEAAKDPQSHFMEIQALTARDGIRGLMDSIYVVNYLLIYNRLRRNSYGPYMLCTGGGAWILNKLRESFANQTSWMLYKRLVKLPVMLDVARGRRLGAWL